MMSIKVWTSAKVKRRQKSPAVVGSGVRLAHQGVEINLVVAPKFKVFDPLALKQMLDHHDDEPTSRGAFLAEAEITGGLDHFPGEAF